MFLKGKEEGFPRTLLPALKCPTSHIILSKQDTRCAHIACMMKTALLIGAASAAFSAHVSGFIFAPRLALKVSKVDTVTRSECLCWGYWRHVSCEMSTVSGTGHSRAQQDVAVQGTSSMLRGVFLLCCSYELWRTTR